jgi:integrase
LATIIARRRKDGTRSYRATIRIMRGNTVLHRETRTFRDKLAAQQWSRHREAVLKQDGVGEKAAASLKAKDAVLVSSLIDRYIAEFYSIKQWSAAKTYFLGDLKKRLGHWDATSITAEAVIEHVRQRLLNGVKPSTAYMDLKWLRMVLKIARGAWGHPVQLDALNHGLHTALHLELVSESTRRDRRPTEEELTRLRDHFDPSNRQSRIPMREVIDFAIASTRRLGEIFRLRWNDIDRQSMTVIVRDMKSPKGSKGNDVVVKLSREALAIIDQQPRIDERVFPFNPETAQGSFARGCQRLGIEDLHFHDLRHEGVSRLFETGYQIHEVAQFSGHLDWGTLRRYTNLRPANLRLLEHSRRDITIEDREQIGSDGD